MTTSLDKLRQQEHIDYGSVEAEWQVLKGFVDIDPDQADEVYIYIFSKYQGYVDNRLRAGRVVLAKYPDETLEMLRVLVNSQDPDDRDTGLQLLIVIGTEHAINMALPLVNDHYAYIAMDAIDFVSDSYPMVVRDAFERLSLSTDSWVVQAVRERMARFQENSSKPI